MFWRISESYRYDILVFRFSFFVTYISYSFIFSTDLNPNRGLYNLVNHQGQMTSKERQAFMVRTVVLLKCLKASGYFSASNEAKLTPDELFIGRLLFHFQTGIQYNLHAVYQVNKLRNTATLVLLAQQPNFQSLQYFNNSNFELASFSGVRKRIGTRKKNSFD